MSSIERKLTPKVLSTANPPVPALNNARLQLQLNPSLRQAWAEAKSLPYDQAADRLGVALQKVWGKSQEAAADSYEVAKYLLDEEAQLGEGVLITRRDTGEALAILKEEDFYTPPPVLREDGTLRHRGPQIRPEILAGLTLREHDKARDERVVAALAAKLSSELGAADPRLLFATKAGRKRIVSAFGQESASDLIRSASGTLGTFLQCFKFDGPEMDASAWVGVCFGSATVNMADPLSANLAHNRIAAAQSTMVASWLRNFARLLTLEAAKRSAAQVLDLERPDKAVLAAFEILIVPPDAVGQLRAVHPKVLPVAGVDQVLGVKTGTGTVLTEERFETESLERFDRWEPQARLSFRAWIDWAKVVVFELHNMTHTATVV